MHFIGVFYRQERRFVEFEQLVPRELFNPSLGKVRSYVVDEKTAHRAMGCHYRQNSVLVTFVNGASNFVYGAFVFINGAFVFVNGAFNFVNGAPIFFIIVF